jgi:hypothetical protein
MIAFNIKTNYEISNSHNYTIVNAQNKYPIEKHNYAIDTWVGFIKTLGKDLDTHGDPLIIWR